MFHRVVPVLVEENVTSKMIQDECDRVLQRYDRQCKDYPAGTEGIDRRNRFVELKDKVANMLPRDGVIEMYDFYAHEKSSSRLQHQIEKGLYRLVGISQPVMTTNLTKNVHDIARAENALERKITQLKQAREQEYQSMTATKKLR